MRALRCANLRSPQNVDHWERRAAREVGRGLLALAAVAEDPLRVEKDELDGILELEPLQRACERVREDHERLGVVHAKIRRDHERSRERAIGRGLEQLHLGPVRRIDHLGLARALHRVVHVAKRQTSTLGAGREGAHAHARDHGGNPVLGELHQGLVIFRHLRKLCKLAGR